MKSCYDEFSSRSADEECLPPILFLHAMMESKRTWKIVGPAIAKKTGRKAYALDARNHGQSPWSSEMNYDVLTKDLEEFMEDKNIRRAVIVGHSMGGRTAINFALKHPERVEAVVIEDMTPRNVKSGTASLVTTAVDVALEIIQNYPPEMPLEDARRHFSEFLIDIVGEKYVNADRIRRQYDQDFIFIVKRDGTYGFEANVEAVASMLKSNALVQNLVERKLVYKGDALFLYGSKPFFQLKNDHSIQKLFPRAVLMEIEGASHMIHFDSPEEYTEVVSDFIVSRNLKASKY